MRTRRSWVTLNYNTCLQGVKFAIRETICGLNLMILPKKSAKNRNISSVLMAVSNSLGKWPKLRKHCRTSSCSQIRNVFFSFNCLPFFGSSRMIVTGIALPGFLLPSTAAVVELVSMLIQWVVCWISGWQDFLQSSPPCYPSRKLLYLQGK